MGATTRNFNIGIQSRELGQAGEIHLSTRTVQAIADLAGRIVVTVYGAGLSNTKAKGKATKSRSDQKAKTRAKERKS